MKKITPKVVAILTLVVLFSGCTWFSSNNNTPKTPLEQGAIILGESYLSRDPFSPVAIDHQYFNTLFEPLVDFNPDYQVVPKLAYTYGQLSDNAWEFKLREGAKFHDGTDLTTENVVKTFEYLEKQDYEHLNDLFTSIKSIEVPNENTVVFELNSPDANFLHKLTEVPIVNDYQQSSLEQNLVGTGPYQLSDIQASQVTYQQFPDYWGPQPPVKSLTIKTATRIGDRAQALNQDQTVLAVTPFSEQYTNTLNTPEKFTISQKPDLTVNFFLWNDNAVNWTSDLERRLLLDLIPRNLIDSSLNENGQSITQFVSPGVIGYNPRIKIDTKDTNTRKKIVEENGLTSKKLRFALPVQLKTFGLDLEADLKKIGIDAESYIIEPEQVFDHKITQGVDLIFVGWKSSRGSSIDFFENFIRPDSTYNLGSYKNLQATKILDQARSATTISDQQAILQNLMVEVIDGRPLGIPLFASTQTVVISNQIELPVRLDGLLMLSEIKLQ